MWLVSQQIERAEVKMSLLLAQHNVPLALADHLSPLIRDIFDGEVAKGYACAKTKTTCILNRAAAPQFREDLVSLMQHPIHLVWMAQMTPASKKSILSL